MTIYGRGTNAWVGLTKAAWAAAAPWARKTGAGSTTTTWAPRASNRSRRQPSLALTTVSFAPPAARLRASAAGAAPSAVRVEMGVIAAIRELVETFAQKWPDRRGQLSGQLTVIRQDLVEGM